ncbi:MAG: SGNH/GDSL hydrolase family protein, partial [Rikenellaceae bacterium]
LLLCATAINIAAAQESKTTHPFFKDGDNVCFIGNSITHGGHYVQYIMNYYATRYPAMKLNFRNKGLGGDRTEGILRRMDNDILRSDPDVAVLMIGMNDVERDMYSENLPDTTLQRRVKERYDHYTTHLTKINEILRENTREMVLFTPSIYDQTAIKNGKSGVEGINEGLYSFGEFIKQEAPKYEARMVDMWEISNRVNTEVQRENPAASFTGGDRIHPNGFGGFVMAYQFIEEIDDPQDVSRVEIDAASLNEKGSFRATISNLSGDKSGVKFDLLSEALPLTLDNNALRAATHTEFIEKYNQERLKITGLKKGSYKLLIDGEEVGEYSASELKEGINLSTNDKTPQYRQSAEVAKLFAQLRGLNNSYNIYALVEYRILSDFDERGKPEMVRKAIEERLKSEKMGYYIEKFNYYLENRKNMELDLVKCLTLYDEAYEMAQPTIHSYEVVATK